eukprot:scaffold860_cov155-Ochromonas_danica.AAC.6
MLVKIYALQSPTSALIAQSVEHSAVTQPPQRCTGYRKVERSRLSWSESFANCHNIPRIAIINS